ncbi:C-terminal processing protease CtpA/Prc, contains a PDZ domain [Tenacibaculum sp. 190130A14a]|uniref:Carboxyl-terminal processing protease n=1 Tax=Tenacibaculum polynesiense TaxID=3137857 RepID=A0ABM9P6I5_9FLAO
MKFFKSTLLLLISIVIFSCSRDELSPENVQVQSFIWRGLNAYYLWQGEIPDLSDNKFISDQQLFNYLSDKGEPANFFNSLLYQKGTIDKWSWIVDDYVALEQAFQGTTRTTGMEFGIAEFKSDPTKVFGYVRYVVAGTDAANKGVTRGMIFTEVDGTELTQQNYRSLLFSNNNAYTIHLADFNAGDPITNATTINLTKSTNTENPILVAKTLDEGGKKIGYLMYNGFISNFDMQLNQVFAQFKADNITELIVDLRYNGGGSVNTATYLASMITGQFKGEIFAKQQWNSKFMNALADPDNLNNRFTDKIDSQSINSLNLTNVYFITTDGSASASELLMNGLVPHITVKSVGTKTHGKYVGSITLYDSPNFYNKVNINPNHKWAMQPIVLEIVNKDGNNDKDGIDPTVEFPEDYGNLGILGDKAEPLLARTLQLITTGSRAFSLQRVPFELKTISSSKANSPTYNNMYVELE